MFFMIQSKQVTGVTFVMKEPQKNAMKMLPKIIWEVPPPDFAIPDEPMDNFDQSLLAEALREALSLAKRTSKNQLCATSLAVCAKVDGQTITKAPDWFYVPYAYPKEKNRRSYTPYAEGKLPTIVMEFLSDDDGKEYDNSATRPYGKWYFYETILQVPWYVIFDSDNGELEVYKLEDDYYVKQNANEDGQYWIDSLELFLGVWKGLKKDVPRNTHWLRWWDTNGNRLPWQYEDLEKMKVKMQKTEAKMQKAEAEKRKAEVEKRKAEVEKQEALEKAKNTTLQIAKQMLQTQVEVAFIQQVTGLNENEILLLNAAK